MKLDTRFEAIRRGIEESDDHGLEEKKELLELIRRSKKVRNQGFKHFLQGFIKNAKKARQEGERDEVLCDCSVPTCGLKYGEVHSGIENKIWEYTAFGTREPENFDPGVKATEDFLFESVHGDPILREALEEWKTRRAQIEQDTVGLYTRVTQNGETDG